MFNEWEPRVHEHKYVLTNRENGQGVDDRKICVEIQQKMSNNSNMQ